jgi:hypothetical protein
MKTFDRIFSKTTFIIFTFFLFSTVVLFNSCEKTVDKSHGITQKDIDLMKENHIIPLQEAVGMYKEYSKDRIKILKDTLKKKYKNKDFEDTRTVWLDIKTMKAYLKYVEDESNRAGITVEGLEFYFGVNSDKESGKKKNHQTFFIAPTTNKDNTQSGYTLIGEGDKEKVIFLKDVLNNGRNQTQQSSTVGKASFFTTTTLVNKDGLLLNDFENSPPGPQ